MAITKMLGFTGEAEILGGLHAITFHVGSGLTIQGLDLDGAYHVLDALARRQITGVNPVAVGNPALPPLKLVSDAVERQADDPRVAEYVRMQGEGFKGSFSDFLDYIHEHAGKGSTEAKALEVAKPLELDKAAFAAGVGPGVVPEKAAEKPKQRRRMEMHDDPPKEEAKPKEAPKADPPKEEKASSTTSSATSAAAATPSVTPAATVSGTEEIPEKVTSSKRFIKCSSG